MFKKIDNIKKVVLILLAIVLINCTSSECGYDNDDPGCDFQNEINVSTGIDTAGNVIPPPTSASGGVVDPFWRILNIPVTTTCSFTSNQDAYTVNLNNSSTTAWVNQSGATSISPFNSGNTNPGTCTNPNNSNGDPIPFVFERSFCVQDATEINLSLSFKADNAMYIELFDNDNSTVMATSTTYLYSAVATSWTLSNFALSGGSYSLRCYLINFQSWTGFSVAGTISTSNSSNNISNNAEGCCENNTISVLNILEKAVSCNQTFDGNDQLANGWVFNLKDSTNTIIRTETTDINGNVFFSGLPDGTYTVEIVVSGFNVAWVDSITVTVTNNQVEILEFYSCPG